MEKRIVIFFILPFLIFWHWFDPKAKNNNNGVKYFKDSQYEKALSLFLKAKGIDPNSPILKNNTAATLYMLNKYKEALQEFSNIDPKKAGINPALFYYNLGNTYYRLNQFSKALEFYKKSLLEDPSNLNCKKNYELTLKKLENKKKNKNKDKKNQKQDKKNNKKPNEKKNNDKKDLKNNKYKNILKYLNQKELEQLKKRKKKKVKVKKKSTKDW